MEPAPPEAPAAFRPIDRASHELLIVDDDPASRYSTARWLRSAGFRTREATTGAQALALADDTISALVLDVHLPDIDGFELCRRLRSNAQTARLPVLHLSAAYVSDDDKVRGLDAGADAYLTHPVEPAVLVATVQALVRTRMAEDARRRSEAKFKAIYEQASGGICLFDDAGRMLDANAAMLKFMQRPLDAVAGHPLADFVPAGWAGRAQAAFGQPGLPEAQLEFPLLDAEGNEVQVEWRISRHIEPGVSMALATDISQRVLLEQERRRALDRERDARTSAEHLNRMKDEFIAVLSHELRSPMNAILGWSQVLIKRGGTEEALRGLHSIQRNVRAQARLVSDLLDMSRLNVGKMRLVRKPVDAGEVLESALTAVRLAADDNDNPLVLDVARPYPGLHADAERLQQVFWNLLSNAVKFSPRGSPVEVGLREDGGGIRLTVTDHGQGIAADFLPLLFDRFTQASGATNRYRGGLGLGLSIVQHLVQAHGGHVSARSEGLGKGSTFEVWLPAGSAADADEAPSGDESGMDDIAADEAESVFRGLQLLVIDDDPEASAILQIILSDRGAEVTVAHDYDEALRAFGASRFDAVVSDVGLPGKDGYELIREIRRREAPGSRVPAIALTSFTRTQDQEHARAAGFDVHCPKPLRPLHLVQQIAQLLGRSINQLAG